MSRYIDTTKYPDLISAAEEFGRQLKLEDMRDAIVAGVGFVGPAEKRGRREAYLEIIQWLELQPGDDFLYAAKRVRSMAGDLIKSVFDGETK